ncbi:hypothetical protein CDL15_Pgr025991 [Punica granatum]|uniref:Uncharacterized protein n=1 Tax=Punica granatum TaxID=22663 RepID=A0A218WD62_PUNGR|nr:hypothetical protein CDL15_Pgr025991 [Punica granatum]PKI43289.1 hypothetical protein CRG98_036375 [Punica granatum]
MGNGAEIIKPNRKPKARLPPRRGQIKVGIFKLFFEKLISLCSSPMAAPAPRETSAQSHSSKVGSFSALPNK